MRHLLFTQLWLAFRIWIFAIVFNTAIGMIMLVQPQTDKYDILRLLFYGLLFGTVYSFPVFLLLFIIFNRTVAWKFDGRKIYIISFSVSMFLSALMFYVFEKRFFGDYHLDKLIIAALSSGAISLLILQKSIRRLGSYPNQNLLTNEN